MMNLSKQKNQKGQALVLVVVSLTVALALIASISLRNLSSVSRVTNTDSFSRVGAAAEAGVERFLALNQSQLSQFITSVAANNLTNADCNSSGTTAVNNTSNPAGVRSCLLSISSSPDGVVTDAYVWATAYPTSGGNVDVQLKRDETYELRLSTDGTNPAYAQNIGMCWKSRTAANGAIMYVIGYTSSIQDKYFAFCSSNCAGWNSMNISIRSGGALSDLQKSGVSNNPLCPDATYDYLAISNPAPRYLGLRVRAIGADADVRFVPLGGASFPQQGFLINSLGVLTNNTTVSATKKTRAFKSFTYPAGIFDFGIYTNGTL